MSILELIQLLRDYQEYLYSSNTDELEELEEELSDLGRSVKRHRGHYVARGGVFRSTG